MKTTLFTTALLSLASYISASAPICQQEGNSLQLANGSFPYNVFVWPNITALSTCKQLCLDQSGCYSYAYHSNYEQCHGYDDIVPLIGFTSNTVSGYYFYDICCSLDQTTVA